MLALSTSSRLARTARRSLGFTLVELLVTLTLVGILVGLAVPGFRDLSANQALSGTISELMTSTMQARSAALQQNRQAVVQPVSGGDWRTGWRVYVDVNANASFDSGTDTLVLTQDPLPSDIEVVTLSGSGEAGSMTAIGYTPDGFVATIGGRNAGTVAFRSATTSREKRLMVSRVGRTRICDPQSNTGC